MTVDYKPTDHDKELNRKRIEKTSRGVFGFFVNRRKVTLVVILMLVAWGTVSLLTLPREANPEVKIPFGIVATVWPGASPEDVEDLVTNEIEEKIENIDNIKEISSTSSGSISSISVEFEADADLDKSIRELRDAVDTVSGLPSDAEDPEVIEVSINDQSIVSFSIIGDLPEQDLKTIAKLVQDEIESIGGVSEAQIVGDRDREWAINIIPARLNQFNLTANDVARAFASADLNLPLGELTVDSKHLGVRSVGKIENIELLGSVVVKNTPQGTILLRDVADINDQLVERRTLSRIAQSGEAPTNALSVQVFKRTGGNIINIVDEARERVTALEESDVIPSSVDIVVTNDNSKFIRDDFNTLTRSGFQTLLLIFISLAVVLALRMAFIALLSIPIIFLASFGIIDLQGSTLNSLTLFSLVLSLGLLIDTTIVLLEGIYEGVSKGYSAQESALLSIATYKWPIIAGVLTTISAFVPMFLVGGIVGEFLKTLPITIAAVLGSSLIVGLLVMPSLSTYFINGKGRVAKKNKLQQRLYDFAHRKYRPTLTCFIKSKFASLYQDMLYAGLAVIFAGTMALIGAGIIKTGLFPEADFGLFVVNIELEQGSVLEDTNRVAEQVEAKLNTIEGLDNYLTTVGRSASFGIGGSSGSSNEHLASIIVNLVDDNERDKKSYEITTDLRKELATIKGGRIEVENVEGGPPTGEPIGVQIRGPELFTLSSISSEIKTGLRNIDGVIEIDSSDKPSPPQFVFHLDHELLGRFNLSAAHVSGELRTALFGTDVGTVTRDGEDIDIVVQYDEDSVITIDDIKNIEITSPLGERVKVSRVADVRIEPALQSISHRDTERTVFISANTDGTKSIQEIQKEVDSLTASLELPHGYRIVNAGEFEDQNAAFFDLYKAMIVAVLLIFLIMVLQFNSYKQPFIILLTLPLAFVGVVIGTFLFGLQFDFPAFLGVVALAGIVVNDAIVLIDRINFNIRQRLMRIDDAVIEAGQARLQPIILTTTTTVLGVIPLAFADEFWRGLSVAIATGMIFATTLTLIVIPLLYRKFERKTYKKELHLYQD